jgi:hypothetical protein
MTQESPQCAWTGVEQDGERVVACDKLATASVADHSGHLHYACDEHIAFVEARAGSGTKQALRPHHPARDWAAPPVRVVLA